MTLNKKVLAGLVAFAAASSSAQAVTVAANDGWELGVSGLINQFLVFTDDKNGDEFSEMRDGLLPAFLNFDMKAPTMNGLDIAAHISFSPGTNPNSYAGFEQREVYFTVAGGFGTILAGKALGLYGSHNILTEQTLFGIGYGTGGNGVTTLGGIGLGYDYASWRSQVKWTSNDMGGFKVALAIMDPSSHVFNGSSGLSGKPTGSITSGDIDSEDLRYEADLSFTGAFDSGSYLLWLSGMYQGDDVAGGPDMAQSAQAWTLGGTLALGGFQFMAQYSDSEGGTQGTAATAAGFVFNTTTGASDPVAAVAATDGDKVEWSQYVVQAGYKFGGTTLVSANFSELEDKSSGAGSNDSVERFTLGVYHDVNANLKLVAEYTKVEDEDKDALDQDIFGIGGFVFF